MTESPSLQKLDDVFLIDTRHRGYQGIIGAYLLPGEAGEFALIECGPPSTLTALEDGIRAAGFDPEGLSVVLVTHIHLDHAAAAGHLAKRYGAQVYVHELGAPHLAEPGRLIASASRIYGEQLEEFWGVMQAVPAEKLLAVKHEDRLTVCQQDIRVLYTPGHASSHVSYLLDGETLFTGDAAAIKLSGSSIIRPALAPPEIDLEIWERSLKLMRKAAAERLLLTHFGEVRNVDEHLTQVAKHNRLWAEEILAGMNAGEDDGTLEKRIRDLSTSELRQEGAKAELISKYRITSNDEMTVTGVKRYWKKHHPERLVTR